MAFEENLVNRIRQVTSYLFCASIWSRNLSQKSLTIRRFIFEDLRAHVYLSVCKTQEEKRDGERDI